MSNQCDYRTNPEADDCNGQMCDECSRDIQLETANALIKKLHLWMIDIYESTTVYPAHLWETTEYIRNNMEQK